MSNDHTFLTFKTLTENCTFEHKQSRVVKPDFNKKFSIEKDEYCRVTALSEILNVSKNELINILLSSALGDAHNGFLSAFTNESDRNSINQQLKRRVKALLLLS